MGDNKFEEENYIIQGIAYSHAFRYSYLSHPWALSQTLTTYSFIVTELYFENPIKLKLIKLQLTVKIKINNEHQVQGHKGTIGTLYGTTLGHVNPLRYNSQYRFHHHITTFNI